MKNIITKFDIFINESYQIIGNKIYEDDSSSGITDKVGIMAASKATTSNADAIKTLSELFKELEKKDKKYVLKGDIKEGNAIFINKDGFFLKPKTSGNKESDHYIKMSDKLWLDGSKKTATYKKTTYKEMLENGIEAVGNGIYALGRLMKSIFDEGKMKADTTTYMGLNFAKPTVTIMSTNTGIQGKINSFGEVLVNSMISTKIIYPNDQNLRISVSVARDRRGQKELYKDLLNNRAHPSIGDIGSADIEKKLIEDVNGDILNFDLTTNAKFKSYVDKDLKGTAGEVEANKIYGELFDSYYANYVKIVTERFKKYFDNIATDLGVSTDIFSEVKDKINTSSEEAIKADKNKVKSTGLNYLHHVLTESHKRETNSVSKQGATTSTSTKKSVEGKY
jgi:hypothetical protein